jgi:geranylgeranyl pyrophosphate synthase
MSQVSIHPRVDLSSQINAILINEMPDEDSSLFDAALHHFKTPGKAFRANLALSSGLALNLKPDSFIYWAAACELLHNASLVHDDISDASTHRRGRPSINQHFGKDVALCLGDWMIAKSFELAARSKKYGAQLTVILASVMQETCNGQVSDTVQRRISSLPAWKTIAASKTAPLLMAPVEGIAMIANLSYCKQSLENIVGLCGLAYQGRNDVNDIIPSSQKSSDLIGRKPNLVISLFAQHKPANFEKFIEWYNSNDISTANKWQRIIGSSEAVAGANSLVDAWLKEADELINTMPKALHNTLKHIVESVKLPTDKVIKNQLA